MRNILKLIIRLPENAVLGSLAMQNTEGVIFMFLVSFKGHASVNATVNTQDN